MRISSLAAGEQVLFLTTGEFWGLLPLTRSDEPLLPWGVSHTHVLLSAPGEFSANLQAFLSHLPRTTLWILAILASLNSQFHLPSLGTPQGTPLVPLLEPQPEDCLEAVKLGNRGAHIPCFMSLGEHCPLLPHVQNLENWSYLVLILSWLDLILFMFLGLFFLPAQARKKVNTVPFTLSWKDKSRVLHHLFVWSVVII